MITLQYWIRDIVSLVWLSIVSIFNRRLSISRHNILYGYISAVVSGYRGCVFFGAMVDIDRAYKSVNIYSYFYRHYFVRLIDYSKIGSKSFLLKHIGDNEVELSWFNRRGMSDALFLSTYTCIKVICKDEEEARYLSDLYERTNSNLLFVWK